MVRTAFNAQKGHIPMSKLTFIDQNVLPRPREGQPLPDRLVEGDPRFLSWDIAQTADAP